MVLLDYNTILHTQLYGTQKSKSRFLISSYLTQLPFFFRKLFFIRKSFKRLNKGLSLQLISAKGIYLDLKQNKNLKDHENLNKIIDGSQDVIKSYSELLASIQDFSKEHTRIKGINSQLHITINMISEIIAIYYDALRLLKRTKVKEPIKTSQIAKDAAEISANSLQTILYGN